MHYMRKRNIIAVRKCVFLCNEQTGSKINIAVGVDACECVEPAMHEARTAASHITGCSGADVVFIGSWPLAVEAAMGRTLALQRANL